ncbi:MAG: signal peptidase I [Vicinamibacterales bacterium]
MSGDYSRDDDPTPSFDPGRSEFGADSSGPAETPAEPEPDSTRFQDPGHETRDVASAYQSSDAAAAAAWSAPAPDAAAAWTPPAPPAPLQSPSVSMASSPAGRDDASGLPTAWPAPAPAQAHAGGHEGAGGRSVLARVAEELFAWFKTLFSAAVYATLIVTFGFQVARVEGLSMAPTLEDQDRLIVNKLAYRLADPQIGDIVMLYYPIEPEKSFVKRVVGEPGDTLRSVQGRVYRNDVPLPDDFIPEEYRDHDTWGPEIVPPGMYFVMGDHRNNSSDSRTWKWVPKKYIIGKVQLRWWPLNHARLF